MLEFLLRRTALRRQRDRIFVAQLVGWPPTGRAQFEQEAKHGSHYAGSPETVARKIAATDRELVLFRFDLKYSADALGHDKLMRAMTLYGSKVRDMLS